MVNGPLPPMARMRVDETRELPTLAGKIARLSTGNAANGTAELRSNFR